MVNAIWMTHYEILFRRNKIWTDLLFQDIRYCNFVVVLASDTQTNLTLNYISVVLYSNSK